MYWKFFAQTNILGLNGPNRCRPSPETCSADTYLGHLGPKYWSEQKTFNTQKFSFDTRNIFCIQHFSLNPIFWVLVCDLSILYQNLCKFIIFYMFFPFFSKTVDFRIFFKTVTPHKIKKKYQLRFCKFFSACRFLKYRALFNAKIDVSGLSRHLFTPFGPKIWVWPKNFQYIKVSLWSKEHFLYSTLFSKINTVTVRTQNVRWGPTIGGHLVFSAIWPFRDTRT